jgi:hypothetical protein
VDSPWRFLPSLFVVAAICLALPSVAAAQAAGPSLVLTEDCSQKAEGGVQVYGARIGVEGFSPNTQVTGSIGFEIINPDGSLTLSSRGEATVTTDANGSYSNFAGLLGTPVVITLTVGSQSKSVRVTCEPKPPSQSRATSAPRPKLVRQCKRGGFRTFKFKTQGQCVAYVRRGPRTR